MIHLLRVLKRMQGDSACVRISEPPYSLAPTVTATGAQREGRNKMSSANSDGFMEKRLKLQNVDNEEKKRKPQSLKGIEKRVSVL